MKDWTEVKSGEPVKISADLDSISKLLVETLSNCLEEFFAGNRRTPRTSLVMEALTIRGYEKGYNVYSHGLSESFLERHREKKFKNVEWLHDLHWYKEVEPKCYKLTHLPLVVECEWDRKRKGDKKDDYGAVKYDFQKLLVANADLRVMIFCRRIRASEESSNDKLDKYFDDAIAGYDSLDMGSKFLFVAFGKKDFQYTEKVK